MGFHSAFLLMLIVVVSLSSAAQKYQQVARDLHNKFRKKHHAPPLSLSADLNIKAAKCAQYYANKGQIDHKCPYKGTAGENLYWRSGSMTDVQVAKNAIILWYSEVKKYDYRKNRFQYSARHFSQLVWKSSKQIGFGVVRKGKKYYACALYSPRGNFAGRFKDNVLRPGKLRHHL